MNKLIAIDFLYYVKIYGLFDGIPMAYDFEFSNYSWNRIASLSYFYDCLSNHQFEVLVEEPDLVAFFQKAKPYLTVIVNNNSKETKIKNIDLLKRYVDLIPFV